MRRFYLVIIILISLTGRIEAQITIGSVKFDDVRIVRTDETLHINMTAELERINLQKQDIMFLTPKLEENNGDGSIDLGALAVTGKVREKVVSRSIKLGRYGYDVIPDSMIIRRNGHPQALQLTYEVPFEEWMFNAWLTFTQVITGCRNCPPCFAEYRFELELERPEPFEPEYRVTYITPEAEPVKRRSESYAARLNYVVDKYDLIRDFKGNAAVLDEVDRIFREINNDESLTIEQLFVTGYASPEGNFNSNMTLSRNRAYAFVHYLSVNHNIPHSIITVDWKGEDWDGLRKVVENSWLEDRDAILSIIDRNPDIAVRKRQLMSYKGGTVYRNLLQNYYPPLRRNEYTISFIARAFDVEEAKTLIRTKPHYLSLNEMFLVANSYPRDSEEFKEVFDIAVRMFPDDPTARINSAAQEIESGLYGQALRRLQGIDSAEAWNNAAVAYAKQGEAEKARILFMRASESGCLVADHNLYQLEQLEE